LGFESESLAAFEFYDEEEEKHETALLQDVENTTASVTLEEPRVEKGLNFLATASLGKGGAAGELGSLLKNVQAKFTLEGRVRDSLNFNVKLVAELTTGLGAAMGGVMGGGNAETYVQKYKSYGMARLTLELKRALMTAPSTSPAATLPPVSTPKPTPAPPRFRSAAYAAVHHSREQARLQPKTAHPSAWRQHFLSIVSRAAAAHKHQQQQALRFSEVRDGPEANTTANVWPVATSPPTAVGSPATAGAPESGASGLSSISGKLTVEAMAEINLGDPSSPEASATTIATSFGWQARTFHQGQHCGGHAAAAGPQA